MDSSVRLVKDHDYSTKIDPSQYQFMVRSLLHAAKATRPDIAYAIGIITVIQTK